MPPFTAFLDANVLYSAELRSFLMLLAVPGIFRRESPAGVDGCGARGEFRTFGYAGQMFSRSIGVSPAEVVARDGFVYAELLPPSKDSDA
jgi:hypothetical protein